MMDSEFDFTSASEQRRMGHDYRHRISAGSIIQLVSKFEGLDNRRVQSRYGGPSPLSKADSCFSLRLKPDAPVKLDSCDGDCTSLSRAGMSQITLPNDSIGVSLTHTPSPANLSSKVCRSRSLKAKPSATVSSLGLGPRHKSVAERRRVFEVRDNSCASIMSPKLSPDTLSSSKLSQAPSPMATNSIVLQPRCPTGCNEYSSERFPTSTQNLQMSHPQHQSSHFQNTSTDAPPLNFETPPEYATSILESSSKTVEHELTLRVKKRTSGESCDFSSGPPCKPWNAYRWPHANPIPTNYQPITTKGTARRSLKSKSPSVGSPRNQRWLENAQRMASSLSASNSNGESVVDVQRRRRPQGFHSEFKRQQQQQQKQDKSTEVNTSSASLLVSQCDSKISGLRQKFDHSKNSNSPILSVVPRTRDEIALAESLRCKPLTLSKSTTVTSLGAISSLRQSTQNTLETSPGIGILSTSISARTQWSEDKSSSPLMEKIGLFEALGRKRDDENGSKLSRETIRKGQARGVRSALRRISATFQKSSTEHSTAGLQNPYLSRHGELHEECAIPKKDRSLASSSYCRSRRETEPFHRELYTHNNEKILDVSRSTLKEYNVNGEGSLPSHSFNRRRFAKSASVNICQKEESPISSTRQNGWHPNSATSKAVQATSTRFRRRIISRSISPFVSKARCSLEQPTPVRANELRRLVSLCKAKITKRSWSGDNA
ncbi:hypothetical protein BGZ63DRAFT_267309 [Mariannaea sp. PMI_226]|nr:hypothetical protein BGZ63DRAFT_267309 [Mariannaea sp. PMI_226]